MAEQANINVGVNIGEGAKSLRTLKQEFKDIQKELDGLGAGTDEYKKKLQQLGAVKDEIDDLNDAIRAETGAGKFQALASVGSAIAGGFAAAQGALSLFGSESEDVQKALLKVQGAMAFAQGLKQLEDLGNALKNAKTVILDFGKSGIQALRSLWTAMLANPITAILVGLTALTAAIVAFMMAEDDETEAIKANIAERERAMAAMDRENAILNKATKYRIDLIKARGATEAEVFAAETKMNEERISQLATQNNTVRENLADLKRLRENADGDERKELTDKYNEQVKLLEKNKAEIFDIQAQSVIKQATLDKKAKDDEAARQKTANDKYKALADERAKAEQELQQKLAILRIENIKDEETREVAKLTNQYELEKKGIEQSKATAETKANALLELERKYRSDLISLIDKQEEERLKKEEEAKKAEEEKKKAELEAIKAAEEKRIADGLAAIENEQAALKNQRDLTFQDQIDFENQKYKILVSNKLLTNAELEKLENEHNAVIKSLDEQRIAQKRAIQDAELDMVQSTLQSASQLVTDFAGKDEAAQRKAFELNKKIKIGLAIIDTIKGVQGAFTAATANTAMTAIFPAYPFIQAGIAGAFGAANIAKIASTQFQSTGGGGGVSAPSGGGGGGAVPAINQVGNTSTNIANLQNQNSQKQEPIKAVVVQTEMASVNQQVNRIEERSKIN